MKKFPLVLFSIFHFPFSICFSQPQFTFSHFDTSEISIATYGEAMLNSNSINNKFFHRFILGNYIIEGAKSQNLTTKNRIGADWNYGIFFSQKLNHHFNYFVHIADRAHIAARFPEDFFELAMYGNKKFAGGTAVLDDTNIKYLRFQQFQCGIINKTSTGSRFGFGISYLKGEENFALKINKGELFTHEYGESLDAELKMKINSSDTAHKGIKAVNGWGTSVDLFAELPFGVSAYNGFFRVEANDAGFIQWNEKSLRYKIDTTIHYEGIYISNIFTDSVFNTLDSINIPDSSVNKKHITRLPTMLKFLWHVEDEKFIFSLGMIGRYHANFSPLVYFTTGYKIKKYISASMKISYGGYGKFAFGPEINFALKNFSCTLGTNNLEGIIFPKYSGGNSGYASLQVNF